MAIFCTLGFLILFDFFAVLFSSKTSKISIRLSSLAAGSGMIQAGSKRWMVFRLGTTEAFNPDGANTMKLCANAELSGSLTAK